MYGLIVKLTATLGRRDDVLKLMGGDNSHTIPGCLSFIVATDTTNENIVWVTEVWESKSAHEAALESPSFKEQMIDEKTVIASYEKIATTHPIQGSSHPLHGEA